MSLLRAVALAVAAAAGGAGAIAAQAATACVEDTLPGRLADAPVRLCVDHGGGQPARYQLWLAGEVRVVGDEDAARQGLVGDWYGHPLRLRCTLEGARHRCALSVDGEAAWRAELELPR